MRELDHGDDVLVDRVDAARPDQPHQVQPAPPLGDRGRRRRAPRCRRSEPSAMAASMRGRSCSTRKPAPRLRWPTSLLPIWPGGSPTASPDASRRQCGHSASSHANSRHATRRRSRLPPGRRPMPEAVEHDQHERPRPSAPSGPLRARPRRAAAAAGAGDDAGHLVDLQAGAADERAVDVGSARNSSIVALVTLPP
jgi:hypothetical protein